MSLTNFQKEFIKLNSLNFTSKELAKKLECDIKKIINYCYNNGYRYKSKRLIKDDFDYILENYRKLTINELAKNLNTKKQNIERFLRKQNLLPKRNIENKFTPTEQKIVNLICKKGIFKKIELAEKLFVKKCTIMTHLNNIYTKTNCHSIAELIFKYYNGLINEYEAKNDMENN